jgi:hypothetical protein
MTRLCRVSAALLFSTIALPAGAQERLFRSVDAVQGKQVRLALVGNVTPDCKVGPKPELKVTSPPKHGTLAIRSGKTKAGSLPRCPNLEVPAEGVFFQAPPKFVGDDEVIYQVNPPGGPSRIVTIKITVRPSAAPGQKAKDESTDL